MTLILYKGRKRQLHIGKKGGKYLLIQGKKRYLKSSLSKKSSSQKKKPAKRKVMKGGGCDYCWGDDCEPWCAKKYLKGENDVTDERFEKLDGKDGIRCIKCKQEFNKATAETKYWIQFKSHINGTCQSKVNEAAATVSSPPPPPPSSSLPPPPPSQAELDWIRNRELRLQRDRALTNRVQREIGLKNEAVRKGLSALRKELNTLYRTNGNSSSRKNIIRKLQRQKRKESEHANSVHKAKSDAFKAFNATVSDHDTKKTEFELNNAFIQLRVAQEVNQALEQEALAQEALAQEALAQEKLAQEELAQEELLYEHLGSNYKGTIKLSAEDFNDDGFFNNLTNIIYFLRRINWQFEPYVKEFCNQQHINTNVSKNTLNYINFNNITYSREQLIKEESFITLIDNRLLILMSRIKTQISELRSNDVNSQKIFIEKNEENIQKLTMLPFKELKSKVYEKLTNQIELDRLKHLESECKKEAGCSWRPGGDVDIPPPLVVTVPVTHTSKNLGIGYKDFKEWIVNSIQEGNFGSKKGLSVGMRLVALGTANNAEQMQDVGELGEDETKKMFKNTRPLYMKFISAVQTLYEELIKTAYIEALRKKSLNDEYTRAREREQKEIQKEKAREALVSLSTEEQQDLFQEEEARKIRHDKAATKIQSVIRGQKTRKIRHDKAATKIQSVIRGQKTRTNRARKSKRNTFLKINRATNSKRNTFLKINRTVTSSLRLLREFAIGKTMNKALTKALSILNSQSGGAKKTPVKKKPSKKTPVKKKPSKKTPVKKKPSKKTPVKKKPVKKTPVKKKPVKKTPVKKKPVKKTPVKKKPSKKTPVKKKPSKKTPVKKKPVKKTPVKKKPVKKTPVKKTPVKKK